MGQTLAHPSAPPAWADVLRALLVLGLGVTSLVELCTYCSFPVNLMVLHCYRPALAISSPSNTVLNSCFLLSFFPDLTSVRPCHPSLLPHPPCFPAVACRASQFDSKVSPKAELWEWEPVQAVCRPGHTLTHTCVHVPTTRCCRGNMVPCSNPSNNSHAPSPPPPPASPLCTGAQRDLPRYCHHTRLGLRTCTAQRSGACPDAAGGRPRVSGVRPCPHGVSARTSVYL